MKKECVAMLLAGGQGSRLQDLTRHLAKPAVPFGGKYRIIDFPLSNCVHSGIDTVGVLTQYQPLALNRYLGSGQPWDLDRSDGGLFILPPYLRAGEEGQWYKGTANAIYQNLEFLRRFSPDYVLILSGDHIYQMDYARLLQHHKETGAACTISVLHVPWEQASRFGIVHTDERNRITGFEEKPEHPKGDLASMGIYLFCWPVLEKALTADEENPHSSNDFGRDVIPALLADGLPIYAYPFSGYWRDVGTIESLWDANMDMLGGQGPLFSPDWPIYTRSPICPPHCIGEGGSVRHSLLAGGCQIFGTVENSVLFHSVTVEANAFVGYSILMPGTRVRAGARVEYAIVAENAEIGPEARVGACPDGMPDWGVSVIGSGAFLERQRVVPAHAAVPGESLGGILI